MLNSEELAHEIESPGLKSTLHVKVNYTHGSSDENIEV